MKYITKLSYAPAVHLQMARPFVSLHAVDLGGLVPWTLLPLKTGKPVPMEAEEKTKDGLTTFSTKLTAELSCPVVLPSVPLAFLAQCLDGTKYLIGLSYRPFPVHLMKQSHPSRYSESPKLTVNISWEAIFPPLEVIPSSSPGTIQVL